MTPRTLALGLWGITFAVAGTALATWIGQSAEGVAFEYRGFTPPLLTLVLVVAASVATIRWIRTIEVDAEEGEDARAQSRRRFLYGSAGVAGGLAGTFLATAPKLAGWVMITGRYIGAPKPIVTDPNPRDEWKGATIAQLRTLGRTGFEISDISLGSGQIDDTGNGEAVARAAIERGVNYFDTAPDYSHSGSETALGKAMKGHRDEMFLATKFCWPHGHVGAGAPVEDYMQVVEGSLQRLQTDYVDLVHIHSCDAAERLLDPNVHEAFDRLKQQGKVRFLGFSSHSPNLERVANAAIDDGRFDVMMLGYHFGAFPGLGDVIDRAAAAGMGVVAMKTLKGGKHQDLTSFRKDAPAFSQAAFKWVLSNPNVSGLVVSFSELQHVDEYLYASGKAITQEDVALLERYDELIAGTHCLQHCGLCLDRCPENLAIDDILRYRMYFEDYGDEKNAMSLYARLEQRADTCIGCAAPCTGACPYGIDIPQRLSGAHRLLTFDA